MSEDTITDSVTMDNLYVGRYPEWKGSRTIAESQTLLRGTVLGLILYGAVTSVADAGNTGDGTVTALDTLSGAGAVVGAYNLECTVAIADGGSFKLVDPNGIQVAGNLTLTVGAGAATVFEVAGLTFTITDGATNFVVGDKFAVTVAEGSGEAVTLDIAATDGSDIFDSILLDNRTTGVSETLPAPVAESGGFREESLIFGGSTTIDDVRKQMRDKNCYTKSAATLIGV